MIKCSEVNKGEGDMKRKLLGVCALLLALSAACSPNSDRSREQTSSPAARDEAMLSPTSFEYGYEGQYGLFGIADTARAYAGDILVGEARALRIIESSSGPNLIEIEVVHYSVSGEIAYRGIAHIQFGFGGGILVYEEAISGQKSRSIFVSWPSGH